MPNRADSAAAAGLSEQATHDYKRNGTATLFAAQNVGPGTATDHCYDRHGKAEL